MVDEQIDNTGITVRVRSSEELIFEGRVKAISSFNKKGTFDVLPLHTHFISIIQKRIVLHFTDGNKRQIELDSGVIQVRKNVVDVFLGFQPLESGF